MAGGPGRDPADLHADRAVVRADPDVVEERLRVGAVCLAMTELRNPRSRAAHAWRVATGRFDVPTDEAARECRDAKTWLRRTIGVSTGAHLVAAGMGVDALVAAVADLAGATRKDGHPDWSARAKGLRLWIDLAQFAGLTFRARPPDVDLLESEAAQRLSELAAPPDQAQAAEGAA
ncbi:MAG: hypothetical protein OXQ31_19400 [Spirochaetaceae bacterium]|nr:hypothetical protein [Spirochaetaceae bacterium]